jgi:hypothetical protein
MRIKLPFSFAMLWRLVGAMREMANDFLRNPRHYEGTSRGARRSNLSSAINAPRFPP